MKSVAALPLRSTCRMLRPSINVLSNCQLDRFHHCSNRPGSKALKTIIHEDVGGLRSILGSNQELTKCISHLLIGFSNRLIRRKRPYGFVVLPAGPKEGSGGFEALAPALQELEQVKSVTVQGRHHFNRYRQLDACIR